MTVHQQSRRTQDEHNCLCTIIKTVLALWRCPKSTSKTQLTCLTAVWTLSTLLPGPWGTKETLPTVKLGPVYHHCVMSRSWTKPGQRQEVTVWLQVIQWGQREWSSWKISTTVRFSFKNKYVLLNSFAILFITFLLFIFFPVIYLNCTPIIIFHILPIWFLSFW